jgi:hypothetical protein
MQPWISDEDRNDKLILFYDNPNADSSTITAASVGITAISQNPPRTAINASLRLIHGMPGFTPLELQVRPLRAETKINALGTPETKTLDEEVVPWVTIGRSEFGRASDYAARTPEIVEVRVVLSGTRDIIAEMTRVQLRAGSSYDFLVLPTTEPGTTRIVILQPRAQTSAAEPGNPEVINEAVAATLTAIAPVMTATPTRISSPTPTRTPIPTNTPHPTNTPGFSMPSLLADPAPPDTVRENVVIYGQNFPPLRQYGVFLDNQLEQLIQTGMVGEDGSFAAVVNLPLNLSAGVHVVRVCVGTCPGQGTEALTLINVAPIGLTPTASPQP